MFRFKQISPKLIWGEICLLLIVGLEQIRATPDNTASNSATTAAPSTSNIATNQQPSSNSNGPAASLLSIDDLLNVTVTSAGQKEQKLSDVASALTVISSDDIHRSGATNLPDLLRYVPGVEVSQANNSDVSVSARGFGGVFASKLLVLVDGRSIYNPIFGGVEWQFQRMMLENIDRVEVIRGPGATIWGANAVNGVINIITKDAADTQGGYASTIYGTKEQGTGNFRYGFQPIQNLSIRFYGQYENVSASNPLPTFPKYDELENGLIGFRADYRPSTDDHFQLSSEASSNRNGEELSLAPYLPRNYFNELMSDENVNFLFEHHFDPDNQLTVQSYYDRSAESTDPQGQFGTFLLQTGDFQIRHSLPINLLPIKQELIYGAEYRVVDNDVTNSSTVQWIRKRTDQTFSLFAQTDLHLIDNVLTLTMGSKYDHNDYTGNEVQPSARLLWKIDHKNSLWWSVSRAVREPALVDNDFTGAYNDAPNLKAEELIAYEMGYRVQPMEELSFDIPIFYNDYHNLIQDFFPPGSFTPTFDQFQKAQIYGIEPSFTAQVQPWWKLKGSYSLTSFHIDNSGIPNGYINFEPSLDTIDPTNQFSLRSSFDLPNNVDVDLGGRYVDKIQGANGYFAADFRVAWRPVKNWELSFVGQNLLSPNHVENPGQFNNSTYVGPEVYGKVEFKF